MSKLTEQQIEQINNIFMTLVEAVEHLQKKVKENEMEQSIYVFSSIVEGYSSVSTALSFIEGQNIDRDKKQIDQVLSSIAGYFEQGNLLKVNEIIQFTFLPTIRRVSQNIAKKTNKKDEIIIGLFHSFGNPRSFYPEPRIKALVEESKKQSTKLLFLTSTDVDFEKQQVEADFYEDGKWKRIISTFPDVISNIGAGKRTQVERKLRRLIPFTSFHVGNKYSLPKRMLENQKYAELLVPFTVCMNQQQIETFLMENNKVVFKALKSNRGEDIYFVTKKGQRYIIEEHKKEKIMAQAEFDHWLTNIILAEKGSYIIQRFILTRTKSDEPYHIRAHVQKNGLGRWVLTFIYPRLGSKKSNLSNVVTDGRIEDFHEFMMREFDENGPKYEADILRLSIEVAEHLDKIYGFGIDELGIDFAIDETGRYWMHEANNGPQTAFHEEKRAINTIAYAKYIAENGIFYDEFIRKSQTGFFQVKLSNLPHYEANEKRVFGFLSNQSKKESVIHAFANEISSAQMVFCLFTPKDIDYDYMLIRAKVFEDDEWTEKIIEYPDVVLDYSQERNNPEREWFYEELMDIPFVNEWGSQQIKRIDLLQEMGKFENLKLLLNDYGVVTSTRDITRVLESSGKVIVQHNHMGSKEDIIIQKIKSSQFRFIEGGKCLTYNGLQLLNRLKEEFSKNNYIFQVDSRAVYEGKPFAIHMDMVYLGKGDWSIIGQYAKEELGESLGAECILKALYGEERTEKLQSDMEKLSKEVASVLRKKYGNAISIISVVFMVDDSARIKLQGIELNKITEQNDLNAFVTSIVKRAKRILFT